MKISELINHLENIKENNGDLEIYDDRYGKRAKQTERSCFVVAYLMKPNNKREVLKFWSEYSNDLEDKSDKVLRVF